MSTSLKLLARDLADEHVGRRIRWSEPDPYDDCVNYYEGVLAGVTKAWEPCGQAGCPCRSYVWVELAGDDDQDTENIGLRYGDRVEIAERTER